MLFQRASILLILYIHIMGHICCIYFRVYVFRERILRPKYLCLLFRFGEAVIITS